MELSPTSPVPTAEQLFADFLDRIEGGEDVDFGSFCSAYPTQSPALQRMHTRWQVMTTAFAQLSKEGQLGGATPSKSVDDLKAKLSTAAGRLARYTLREEIARGAMGRIVHAWDEELRRDVALKIHRGAAGDTRMQRRFLEEAQIAAQLDHPGIVPIHELGLDDDGRPFFSMQLVKGRNLGQLLLATKAGEEGWSRTRVLGVLLRVCEAMAFAHDKGVVHRDLKPANIMVGRFGETYVMDWGLAHVHRGDAESTGDANVEPDGEPAFEASSPLHTLRADIAEESSASALLTQHDDIVGTPAYMAPEQAVRGSRASPAADVYAIGAILYHLLTGDMPYADSTRSVEHVLAALRRGPPRPIADDVPPELRAMCERAMARDPAARYPDMGELAEDLRAFLEVRTVRAYATGRFAELSKWIARNRALTTLAGALLLALAVGTIAVTSLWIRAETDRVRADSGAERLQIELDRSTFQRARQALQLDNSMRAADSLWRSHFAGRMPRATIWALKELAERDPYLATLPLSFDYVPVGFGQNGAVVLVGGSDGRLQLREVDSLSLIAELGEPGPRLVSLVTVEPSTAICGTTAGEVLVFDLAARSLVRRTTAHGGNVGCIAADGGVRFATACADGRVLWWQGPHAEPEVAMTLATRATALAVHTDAAGRADRIVAGDASGNIVGRAIDGSWQIHRRFGAGSITAILFGDAPHQLWISGADHQLHFVDTLDASREWEQPTRNGTGRELMRDRDGSVLLGGWWRTDRVAADGSSFAPVALRGLTRFAADPQRRRLVTSNRISGLGVIDLAPVDRRQIEGAVAVALSGDGRRFATSNGDRVTVRAVEHNSLVTQLPTGVSGWMRLDCTGSRLAVAQVGRLQLFDVATGALLLDCEGPTDIVGDACQFSGDGSELAFAVGAEALRRVRSSDGSEIATYSLSGLSIMSTAYSDDGQRLATVVRNQTFVRIFDLAAGTLRDEDFAADLSRESPTTIAVAALSHDGRRIAVGNWQGLILVRDADGTTVEIPGHTGTVWGLQFAAADPGLLCSSGGAEGLACWDLDTRECCYQAIHDQARQLQLSRDGRTVACVVPTGALLLDLSYRDRHIAGNLGYRMDRLGEDRGLDPTRERELREWAATVLARPWPRWR